MRHRIINVILETKIIKSPTFVQKILKRRSSFSIISKF